LRSKLLIVFLFLAVSNVAGKNPPLPPPARWIELPSSQLEIDGLPWYRENKGELYRLPMRLKDTYPVKVWNLAKSPSGGRIRFRTDSSALAIRLEYPSSPSMLNMAAFGQSGVDLYVDNTFWYTAIADKDAKPGKIYEHVYFNFGSAPRVERNITLYLPLYIGVKVLAIGVDPNAVIKPPRPFALPKPVVYYGTSITQGCCASRSGMSYEAIVGRRLNLDFVNLGFSGNGKYEPALAQAVASIDAACYVLDGSNFRTVDNFRKVFAPFIETIRAKRPETPIVVISPLYSSLELSYSGQKHRDTGMWVFTRDVVSRFIANGDKNIQLIEGTDLLSPIQGDGLTDGVHPNDLGFNWVANGITRRLAAVLALNNPH
jgi:lysophospholipase L1-like esterase